jgi:hypothetical protein
MTEAKKYRFVSDDDGHDYLIPADKKEAFDAWLEHQGRLWEPGLSEAEFKARDAEYTGEDFDDYKCDSHQAYTFEKPEVG